MFVVRPTTLRVPFVEQPFGLFTLKPLARGSPLFPLRDEKATKMNDADMNLGNLLGVVDPLIFEKALDETKKNYEKKVTNNNVIVRGGLNLVALRKIEEGEELLRKYGWSVWIREIAESKNILNQTNFAGFWSFSLC